jgi:FAD/FMN-containing dehydrogenase
LIFGHIADGNIHLACLDEDGSRKHLIERIVYDAVREWQGSITAEHGIGTEKRAFLSASRSGAYIALMRAVKNTLDPRNLLNPGKVIPPPDTIGRNAS